jgi:hypothetical protein
MGGLIHAVRRLASARQGRANSIFPLGGRHFRVSHDLLAFAVLDHDPQLAPFVQPAGMGQKRKMHRFFPSVNKHKLLSLRCLDKLKNINYLLCIWLNLATGQSQVGNLSLLC